MTVRASSAVADAPDPGPAGPLRLVRPLAGETLERVLGEAESLYRARQFDQARQAYATLVELEPGEPRAWLRLGNLHQHAGRDADALDAYRRASLAAPSTRVRAEARGKALLNVALLSVAAASRAIDELDAMRLASLADARTDAARQVGAQRHRAIRAAARDFEPRRDDVHVATPIGPSTVAASVSGAVPAAPAAPALRAGSNLASEVAGPWTVDRWTGRSRRPPSRRETPGRGLVVEPVLDSPAPVSSSSPVEVLRGGSSAPKP